MSKRDSKKDLADRVIEILELLNKASEKELAMVVGPTQRKRFMMDIFLCISGLLDKANSKVSDTREVIINAYDCLSKIYINEKKTTISKEIADISKMIVEEVVKRVKEGKLTSKEIYYLRTLLENINMLVMAFRA
jgi:hypothetical protein